MQVIADYLGMPAIAVHEVTTFYNMYNQQAGGQVQAQRLHQPAVRSCRDGENAPDHLKQKLGIDYGGTTADGVFTLQKSECMGACADAPVMLVNDHHDAAAS